MPEAPDPSAYFSRWLRCGRRRAAGVSLARAAEACSAGADSRQKAAGQGAALRHHHADERGQDAATADTSPVRRADVRRGRRLLAALERGEAGEEERSPVLDEVEPVGLGAHDVAQLLAEPLLVGEGDLELGDAVAVGHEAC